MYYILTETLMIVAFIAGYLLGQHKKVETVEKVVYKVMQINEEELLDPISPDDQYLYRKMIEEEAAKHGFTEEE